jgi:antitoxin CptB
MPKQLLTKKLLYRSTHRGCKETDFLIGGFAQKKLGEIGDLELFSKFLDEDDLKIYDWILGKVDVPEAYVALIEEIQQFHKIFNS